MAPGIIKKLTEKANNLLTGIFDLLVFVLLGAIDFLTLILGKYINHRLNFDDFNLWYMGNFLTLVFSGSFILFLIIFWVKDRQEFTRKRMLLLILWFLGFAFTIAGGYMNQSNSGIDINLLDTPFYKLYTGVLFNIGFAFKATLSAFVVIKIFSPKRWAIVYTGVLLLFYYLSVFLYTYIYVSDGVKTGSTYNEKNPAEVAVVLGAAVWKYNRPSTILKMRIDKGLQLYSRGIVHKLQLTGSNAPGELPEADVAFYYLLQKRINPADIRIESESRSTLDQISYIKNTLIQRNGFQKIIIVSDAFHLTRVKEMAEFYNLSVDLVKSDLVMSDESVRYYKFREVVGLINFWMFGVK